MPERFTRADVEAAYCYLRGSLESIARSCQSPAATPAPSGLEDVYCGNLDDDWKVDGDNGGNGASGRWKDLRSKIERYRHLVAELGDPQAPDSFGGLFDW